MTTNARNAWRRVGDAAKTLGEAMATPRGAAPDRAARAGVRQRKHW
jgi:hypothetical protein